MMYAQFTIYGPPQGKARARTVRNRATGKTMSYTPEKTAVYENLVRMEYQAQCKDTWFTAQMEISAVIEAYYPIPASISEKRKELMRCGANCPTKKPDCDNIAKVILDALNGIAYRDDAQIVTLIVHKFYSDAPRVHVLLRENPLIIRQ